MERAELAERLRAALKGVAAVPEAPAVIEESDPVRFMAAFAAAVGGTGPVFLADPAWRESERAALAAIRRRGDSPEGGRGWLMIPSGGTSGALKFARHDQDTLAAAVRGFCAHFGAERVDAAGVLPLHHVSGLMAWLRTVLSGGTYQPWDWKRLEAGDRPVPSGAGLRVISLVPTQLHRLLESAGGAVWLRGFDIVFAGGGPVWPALAETARRERLPLSIGYGMTETAAMAAAMLPRDFLAGAQGCGRALPHAKIALTAEGLISIEGESLFRGYFPEWRPERSFTTEDLGQLDSRGNLHVLGRRDAVIVTGGKKVDPAEVEDALRASGEFADLAVIGLPDAEWGQVVVACHPAGRTAPDAARVAASLEKLAAYKRPRRLAAISDWPRNAQGKLNRAELLVRLERIKPAT